MIETDKNNNTTFVKERYKQTKLGLIPKDWSIKSLDELGVFSKGKGITKKDILEDEMDGLPCVRYAEIYTIYHYNTKALKSKINQESAENSNPINYGDILFAGSGETLEDIGKSIAYLGKQKAYAGGDIIILKQENQDSKYLGYLFNNDVIKNQLFKIGQGHSVVHIYASGLKKVLVPLPTLPEQQKIANILNTWDKAIATQEKLITEKQKLKKGLMQQLLTGKKRFAGFNEKWEEVRLNKLVKINPKNGELPKEFEYISLESVKKGKLKHTFSLNHTNAPSRAQRVLRNNDVLFQTVRPYQMNNYYFDLQDNYVASTGYALLRCSSEIAKFVYYLIHTEQFVNKVLSRCTGSNYPAINPSLLGKIKIKVPKLKTEKIMISVVLADIDNELNSFLKILNQLKIQKQGLMQQLLTGEKRVKL